MNFLPTIITMADSEARSSIVSWLLGPDPLPNAIAQGSGKLADAFVLQHDMTLTYIRPNDVCMHTELCDSMEEATKIVGLDKLPIPRVVNQPTRLDDMYNIRYRTPTAMIYEGARDYFTERNAISRNGSGIFMPETLQGCDFVFTNNDVYWVRYMNDPDCGDYYIITRFESMSDAIRAYYSN